MCSRRVTAACSLLSPRTTSSSTQQAAATRQAARSASRFCRAITGLILPQPKHSDSGAANVCIGLANVVRMVCCRQFSRLLNQRGPTLTRLEIEFSNQSPLPCAPHAQGPTQALPCSARRSARTPYAGGDRHESDCSRLMPSAYGSVTSSHPARRGWSGLRPRQRATSLVICLHGLPLRTLSNQPYRR